MSDLITKLIVKFNWLFIQASQNLLIVLQHLIIIYMNFNDL
jgi:hypothetical protein